MHYAAGLCKRMAHDEFEDTDLMKLLLEFNGDTKTPTKMVNAVMDKMVRYCFTETSYR